MLFSLWPLASGVGGLLNGNLSAEDAEGPDKSDIPSSLIVWAADGLENGLENGLERVVFAKEE
jgi:hypothetical protein